MTLTIELWKKYADECYRSFEKSQKDDNTFWTQHKNFTGRIEDADAYVENEEDIKQAESLIALLLKLDFRDLDQSKDWQALMNLMEDRGASKLEKSQKSWKSHLDTLQASLKTSLDMTQDLYKKLFK